MVVRKPKKTVGALKLDTDVCGRLWCRGSARGAAGFATRHSAVVQVAVARCARLRACTTSFTARAFLNLHHELYRARFVFARCHAFCAGTADAAAWVAVEEETGIEAAAWRSRCAGRGSKTHRECQARPARGGVETDSPPKPPTPAGRSGECADCVARREQMFPGEPFPFCWCLRSRRLARDFVRQLDCVERPLVFELLSQHPDAIAARLEKGIGDAEVALIIELLLAEGTWAKYFVEQPPPASNRRAPGSGGSGEVEGGAGGDGEEGQEGVGVARGGWWSASQRHGVTALHMLVSGGCDEGSGWGRRLALV